YAAIVVVGIKAFELQPQVKIGKGFVGQIQQSEIRRSVRYDLSVDESEALSIFRVRALPGVERIGGSIKKRREAGISNPRYRSRQHIRREHVGGAMRQRDACQHGIWRAQSRENGRACNVAV